jgi:hypothetical protein
MNCDFYQQRVSAFMDDELNDNGASELFAHLGSCTACREFLRTTMQIDAAMNDIVVPDPIGLGDTGTMMPCTAPPKPSHLTRLRRIQEMKIPFSYAAAAVIAVMAGTFAFSSLSQRQGAGATGSGKRIVYSYVLPTVYVQPHQTPK